MEKTAMQQLKEKLETASKNIGIHDREEEMDR